MIDGVGKRRGSESKRCVSERGDIRTNARRSHSFAKGAPGITPKIAVTLVTVAVTSCSLSPCGVTTEISEPSSFRSQLFILLRVGA